MKIIEPSVTLYGPVPTVPAEAIKFIEQCGRLCYKSEDKITDTSAAPFVNRLVKAGHLAMVEHSNFVVRSKEYGADQYDIGKYLNFAEQGEYTYIGGNLTAWWQQGQLNFLGSPFEVFLQTYADIFNFKREVLKNIQTWHHCPHNEIPKELHRYSARFICDRGVTHELVRHRPAAMDWCSEFVDSPLPLTAHKFLDASFAQESTRYVNYGGKSMEFVEPWWYKDAKEHHKQVFRAQCLQAELAYGYFLAEGHKTQAARAVLPNALKTEIIVTADAEEWRHIFKLRTALDAHPDMRRVMIPLREEFKEKYPEAFE